MDPEVLVLDEPTAGLDPRTTASLCKLFVELSNQGRTLVLISHDMELIGHLATHVVVLRQGPDQVARAGPRPCSPILNSSLSAGLCPRCPCSWLAACDNEA